MSSKITLVVGDTAKPIRATLSNADGPQNLTGATVELHLKDPATNAAAIVAACTVVGALTGDVETPGSVRAAWPVGDYQAEYRVAYADGSVDVFPSESSVAVVIRARRT